MLSQVIGDQKLCSKDIREKFFYWYFYVKNFNFGTINSIVIGYINLYDNKAKQLPILTRLWILGRATITLDIQAIHVVL